MPHDEAKAFTARWRATLHEHGLLGVTWPREYGGAGLTKLEQVVLVEELAKAGVPSMGPNDTFSMKMVGGLLLRWGTDEQKRTVPAADPVRRRPLVPGLLRARQRIRPGRPAHQRHARR